MRKNYIMSLINITQMNIKLNRIRLIKFKLIQFYKKSNLSPITKNLHNNLHFSTTNLYKRHVLSF